MSATSLLSGCPVSCSMLAPLLLRRSFPLQRSRDDCASAAPGQNGVGRCRGAFTDARLRWRLGGMWRTEPTGPPAARTEP